MIRGDLSIIGGPSLKLVTKLSSELLGFKIPSLVGDFGSMLYSRTYSSHLALDSIQNVCFVLNPIQLEGYPQLLLNKSKE